MTIRGPHDYSFSMYVILIQRNPIPSSSGLVSTSYNANIFLVIVYIACLTKPSSHPSISVLVRVIRNSTDYKDKDCQH